ncbi:MAG: SLC13 family permease, partial [Nitrospinota bacterium]
MSTGIESSNNTVDIEAKWYFLVCSAIAVLIGVFTWTAPASPNLLGIEVFATIIALFIFGSIKYRIDKNAITYGALLIILVTFFPMWWPKSQLRQEFLESGGHAIWEATKENILTLHGLEKLVHADTMLFILGLTFFVSVISQTRLLETISMNILRIFEGRVFATVILICALVSFASGIMDGVSMIGLTIRVLTIILIMAKVKEQGIKFIIMVSVVLTTVCGMWLAYGEPPNLIMKSNLGLPDSFFLKYAMPMAVVTFIIVAIFIYRWLMGKLIPLNELDVLEQNIADIRFLQAGRKGESKDLEDMLMEYYDQLGDKAAHVRDFYHEGHHPISSMIIAGVDKETVHRFIREYLGEEFLEPVSNYYHFRTKKNDHKGMEQELIEADIIDRLLDNTRLQRRAAQVWGKIAFIPFIGLLIWHASNHNVPLFIASMAGFIVALLGILPHPKMRKLAFHEAVHEYKEYLFLFPLFLSISLLTAVGCFDQMK